MNEQAVNNKAVKKISKLKASAVTTLLLIGPAVVLLGLGEIVRPHSRLTTLAERSKLYAWYSRFAEVKTVEGYQQLTKRVAKNNGINEDLFYCLVETESDFNPSAVSISGAKGLSQVMPLWLKELELAPHQLFDPYHNLAAGAYVLKHYLDSAKGDVETALRRYNGGPGCTNKCSGYADNILTCFAKRALKK